MERLFVQIANRIDKADKVGNGLRNALIGDAVSRKGILKLTRQGEHHFDNRQPELRSIVGADVFAEVQIKVVRDWSSKDCFHAF